jgi:hypothetical protein
LRSLGKGGPPGEKYHRGNPQDGDGPEPGNVVDRDQDGDRNRERGDPEPRPGKEGALSGLCWRIRIRHGLMVTAPK